jgi:hypothetical protein
MTTRWERAASAKFPCKKQQAIAALLTQPTVAEAARVTDIRPQTLYRWMKDPEFIAVYRKARRVNYRQAIARLQQTSAAVVTVLLKVMYDPGAPASARLKAADSVLRHAKAAGEMEEIGARLSDLKRAREASKRERHAQGDGAPPAEDRGSSPMAGHGAKFPRKKEAAIVALLTQRNVQEAARVTGIGPQTLYRWMEDPEFDTAYVEARLAAFGQAGARLQQASDAAVSTLLRIAADPGTPACMRVRAADLALTHARNASEEDIEARLSELDRATEADPAVLHGDRRTFDDEDPPPFIITLTPRERPREAA